jgi:alpha-N-acetylglucosaminidase
MKRTGVRPPSAVEVAALRCSLAVLVVSTLLLSSCEQDPGGASPREPERAASASPARVVDPTAPARQLIVRWIGLERANQVTLQLQTGTTDSFGISGVGGLTITGTSIPALLMGFNWYLKYVARADISINGSQLNLPAQLPLPAQAIQRTSTVKHRFALNDTNEGYTNAYQSWEEWERQIDVLALNGVNEALVYVGQEAVYYETLQSFGYTKAELLGWIPQPGHQPWWLLQNMCCFPSALSEQLIYQRAALGRRIADRMRELGIMPVFPGYYGTVPTNFASKNPGANTVAQGSWAGFTRPSWLDPTGDHFRRVAATFYAAQDRLFGPTEMYKMDLLHEGGTAGTISVSAASRAVQAALNLAHPTATWAILGWLGNPLPDTLSAIDKSKMLILDGVSDIGAVSDRERDFQQTPYAFGTIWNFGGHTALGAPVAVWNQKFHAFRTRTGSRVAGIALMPEAITNNPVAVEFFMELPWQSGPVDLRQWFTDYARARYGADDPHAIQMWLSLLGTAYNASSGEATREISPVFALRPSLNARAADLNYPPRALDPALVEALQVAPAARASSAYTYDLVRVAAQALGNRSRELLPQIAAAYNAGNLARLRELNTRWLDTMVLLDELLATDPYSLLGTYLEDAKRLAATVEERAALEYDARSLITIWGNRQTESIIPDYARRDWAGLMGDYYAMRWRTYLRGLETALQNHVPPAAIDWYAVGHSWARQQNLFPVSPTGSAHEVATRALERLFALDVLLDPPATTRPGSSALEFQGTLQLFRRASNNTLRHIWWDGGWKSEPLATPTAGEPVAITWSGPLQPQVFNRGTDGTLRHTWWNGTAWNTESLGGAMLGDPAVTAYGSQLQVFTRGTDNALQHVWWDGVRWTSESLGYTVIGSPVAMQLNTYLLVLARGPGDSLRVTWWNGAAWQSRLLFSGAVASDVTLARYGNSDVQAFARGPDNTLRHLWWDGGSWKQESLGGAVAGSPVMTTYGSNQLQVFIRNTVGSLQHTWWNGSTWGSEPITGPLSGDPTVTSFAGNQLHIFGRGTTSSLAHVWWNGTQWNSESLGGHLP